MAEKDKKYYWLKLKRDFFKRHDIKIIEKVPNGKDYLLFYLKLLCESVDHEGGLRFSEEIPYKDDMLAIITDTNIDIVRSAVKLFIELKMMELLDDGTFYMNEVNKMLGGETYWAERKRIERKVQNIGQFPTDVQLMSNASPTCPSKSIELEIELDKEIDKDIYIPSKSATTTKFIKPTIDEIALYCKERNNCVDADKFYNYYESKGWVVGKVKMKNWKACVHTWEKSGYNNSSKKQENKLPEDMFKHCTY